MPHRQPKLAIFNGWFLYALLFLIVGLSIPFAIYAFKLGNTGFALGLANIDTEHIPLNKRGFTITNHGLSIHLILGAFLTLLAPVQVILGWSRKAMQLHRWIGYFVVVAAVITGVGGLVYTIFHGTIGGPVMNIAFGTYGVLVVISGLKAAQHARAKNIKLHEEWSMRLFVLAVGSWIYRLGYGIIFTTISEDLGPVTNFQGPIDYFMDFAFFVPSLIGLEIYFRRYKDPQERPHPLLVSFILLAITVFFIYGFYGFFG